MNWKGDVLEVYKKFIPSSVSNHVSPVRIAVLDTGVDLNHPDIEARLEQIKGKYNWVDEGSKGQVHDRNGHGTCTTGLLLDFAPNAEIYVAKVAEMKLVGPETIAKVPFSGMMIYGRLEANAYRLSILLSVAGRSTSSVCLLVLRIYLVPVVRN